MNIEVILNTTLTVPLPPIRNLLIGTLFRWDNKVCLRCYDGFVRFGEGNPTVFQSAEDLEVMDETPSEVMGPVTDVILKVEGGK